jgi:anaerobic magnesium-protoporphyrin IX monomethyl ester cyclase
MKQVSKMKVSLITPNWRLSNSILPTDTLRPPPCFPLEWGYVIAQARKQIDISVFIHDEYTCNRPQAALSNNTIAKSDFLVISTTPSYLFWRCPPLSLKLIESYVSFLRLVSPLATIILVGPHGTVDPNGTLQATGADFTLRGEIDPWLIESLQLLKCGVVPEYLSKKGSESIIAIESPFTTEPVFYDVDIVNKSAPHTWLPYCAEELVRRGGAYALLETSRGCSYDCGFCLRAGFRRKLRLKPLLVVELDALKKLGVNYVYLIDETFGLPWKHASGVIAALKSRDITFGVQTRPDIWSEEKISILRQGGCIYVELGTESLSIAGLKSSGKFTSDEDVVRNTMSFRKYIPYIGVNILDVGNPDLNITFGAQGAFEKDNEGRPAPPFIPYPGTEWGDHALRVNGLSNSWDSAEILFGVYSYMSRSWAMRRMLHSQRFMRRIVLWWIRIAMHLSTMGSANRTRFEKNNKYYRKVAPNRDRDR